MKIAINGCYGGFGLSHKAIMRYAELKGIKIIPFLDETTKKVYGNKAPFDNPHIYVSYKDENGKYFSTHDINRTDTTLIKVIQELKDEANGPCAKLRIIDIPSSIDWEIDEYDGMESVEEIHRSWS